jgi:hypothetical protein
MGPVNSALWYKAWLDTRLRFLIGLGLLTLGAFGTVVVYQRVVTEILPLATTLALDGPIGQQVAENSELARTYRGFVWSQWFRQNMRQIWTLFAVLIGTGVLAQSAGRGALFTLSLPVSRSQLVMTRAGTGLAELAALALMPSLVFPLLSPLVGQPYAIGDALVHAACMFVAGSVFFSFVFLLSTEFNDVWSPLLITVCVWGLLAMVFELSGSLARSGPFRLMSAERYFRGEGVPWVGLLLSLTASVAMLFAATRNFARRDF